MTHQELHKANAIADRIVELEYERVAAERLQELFDKGGDLEMTVKVNGEAMEVRYHHMPVDMEKFFKNYIGYVSAELAQERREFEKL